MTKRSTDSRLGAMIKGAVVGLAAQAAFAGLFFSLTPPDDGLATGDDGGTVFLLTLHAAALVPTLLTGAGLGCIARRAYRARALVLVLSALLACVGVFAATFALLGLDVKGLWIGALFAIVFGALLAPIGIASGLALAAWVRGPEPVHARPA